jgi:excisionase family DNA binding protein
MGVSLTGPSPEYLSAKEAAALLGISELRMYRGLANKTLPGIRIGGRWRIDRHQLLKAVGMEPSESGRPQPLCPCVSSCPVAAALRQLLRAVGVQV